MPATQPNFWSKVVATWRARKQNVPRSHGRGTGKVMDSFNVRVQFVDARLGGRVVMAGGPGRLRELEKAGMTPRRMHYSS